MLEKLLKKLVEKLEDYACENLKREIMCLHERLDVMEDKVNGLSNFPYREWAKSQTKS